MKEKRTLSREKSGLALFCHRWAIFQRTRRHMAEKNSRKKRLRQKATFVPLTWNVCQRATICRKQLRKDTEGLKERKRKSSRLMPDERATRGRGNERCVKYKLYKTKTEHATPRSVHGNNLYKLASNIYA